MAAYKSDIEIAQETELMPIEDIAAKLGLTRGDIELYGNYKAKIDYGKFADKEDKAKQPSHPHPPERERLPLS